MNESKKTIIFFGIVFLVAMLIFQGIASGVLEGILLPIMKNVFSVETISLTELLDSFQKIFWFSYIFSVIVIGLFKLLAVYLSLRLTFSENDITKKDSLKLKKVFALIILGYYVIENLIIMPESLVFAIAPITIALLSLVVLNLTFKKIKM